MPGKQSIICLLSNTQCLALLSLVRSSYLPVGEETGLRNFNPAGCSMPRIRLSPWFPINGPSCQDWGHIMNLAFILGLPLSWFTVQPSQSCQDYWSIIKPERQPDQQVNMEPGRPPFLCLVSLPQAAWGCMWGVSSEDHFLHVWSLCSSNPHTIKKNSRQGKDFRVPVGDPSWTMFWLIQCHHVHLHLKLPFTKW